MQKVRLPDTYVEAIKRLFREIFGKDDHLWLFGSRVDLGKRGGDIDLYIETHEPDVSKAVNKRGEFWVALQCALGEQKIDIVLNRLISNNKIPIYNVARTDGVKLT